MSTVGVVTGAGRGMGRACAERMATMVDVLVLVDLDEAAAKAAAHELTGRGAAAEPFVLDVTDRDGLARLAARVAEAGRLRAVAHAAGVSPTMADWRRMFEVDLVGSALLVDALRPQVGEGTAVVCYASMAAHLAPMVNADADAALDDPLHPDLLDRVRAALGESIEDSGAAYSWAKRGVIRLVRREAMRLGPLGARINSVSPGVIDTPMGRQEAETHTEMAQMVEMSALSREGLAAELAAATTFLLSAEASFVTGTDLLVDGGAVAAVAGLLGL